jgi:hypothetical protein
MEMKRLSSALMRHSFFVVAPPPVFMVAAIACILEFGIKNAFSRAPGLRLCGKARTVFVAGTCAWAQVSLQQ